jgi:hypothetical protein
MVDHLHFMMNKPVMTLHIDSICSEVFIISVSSLFVH